MIKTALFFGSFNPIHKGHTAIARAVVESGLCDELRFVVSPQNPLKDTSLIIDKEDRLEMVRLAVKSMGYGDKIGVSDIEFSMPSPSYTIDTLRVLSIKYPDRSFMVVMGSDNMISFDKWKDYLSILEDYKVIVYPREGYSVPKEFADKVLLMRSVPFLYISSTQIRNALIAGDDVDGMVERPVKEYIIERGLWGISSRQAEINRLTEAINDDPQNIGAYMNRGEAYQRIGEKDKALNDFLKVLELDPKNLKAQQYATMLREIFEYAYKEIYNP